MTNTPHINLLDDIGFAKTVLMPGDPLRAKMIAETFLENAVLINNVRNIQGYTGFYKGHKVSVMASGMGIPSIGIYSYELFSFFGVENIIRIGSAGGIGEGIKLRDVVAGIGANTNSAYLNQYGVTGTLAPTCSYELLRAADECAKEIGIELKVGNLLSSDTFYDADEDSLKKWAKAGSVAVEMEAAGLYLNAMHLKKRALAICTISDLPFSGESCSAEERQNTFTDMMKIALETAVRFDK
ncbi:MAG: purine-nucleoside phosphorylase [Clostridia bacterium]|nr:purine-nucleoside phosphorylase [Oscillospiraceae bacterium]MBQ7005085.1 purine-nucleoside phosphorylase [Clostridia bacterium]